MSTLYISRNINKLLVLLYLYSHLDVSVLDCKIMTSRVAGIALKGLCCCYNIVLQFTQLENRKISAPKTDGLNYILLRGQRRRGRTNEMQ